MKYLNEWALLVLGVTPILASHNQITDHVSVGAVASKQVGVSPSSSGNQTIRIARLPEIESKNWSDGRKVASLLEQIVAVASSEDPSFNRAGEAWKTSVIFNQDIKSSNSAAAAYNPLAMEGGAGGLGNSSVSRNDAVSVSGDQGRISLFGGHLNRVKLKHRARDFDTDESTGTTAIQYHLIGESAPRGYEKYEEHLARDKRTELEKSLDINVLRTRNMFRKNLEGLESLNNGVVTRRLQTLLALAQKEIKDDNQDIATHRAMEAILKMVPIMMSDFEALKTTTSALMKQLIPLLSNIQNVFDSYIDNRSNIADGIALRDAVMDHLRNTDVGIHSDDALPRNTHASIGSVNITAIADDLLAVYKILYSMQKKKLGEKWGGYLNGLMRDASNLKETEPSGSGQEMFKLLSPFTDYAESMHNLDLFVNFDDVMNRFVDGIHSIEKILSDLTNYYATLESSMKGISHSSASSSDIVQLDDSQKKLTAPKANAAALTVVDPTIHDLVASSVKDGLAKGSFSLVSQIHLMDVQNAFNNLNTEILFAQRKFGLNLSFVTQQ